MAERQGFELGAIALKSKCNFRRLSTTPPLTPPYLGARYANGVYRIRTVPLQAAPLRAYPQTSFSTLIF